VGRFKLLVARPEDIPVEGRLRRKHFSYLAMGGAVCVALVGIVGGLGVHLLSAVGLVLDISGALLLVSGLMVPEWAAEEMGTTRGETNSSVRAYWRETRRDARLAGTLLAAGFLFQALGAVFG